MDRKNDVLGDPFDPKIRFRNSNHGKNFAVDISSDSSFISSKRETNEEVTTELSALALNHAFCSFNPLFYNIFLSEYVN